MNREQIEERIFDYHEGNLDASNMKELESFIADNPEYQVDFDAWKESYYSDDEKTYPFADQLVAGSGSAWMKWSVIALLLLGSAYGINYTLNMKNGPVIDSNSMTINAKVKQSTTVGKYTNVNQTENKFTNVKNDKGVKSKDAIASSDELDISVQTGSNKPQLGDQEQSPKHMLASGVDNKTEKKRTNQSTFEQLKKQNTGSKKSGSQVTRSDEKVAERDYNIALANPETESENGVKRFKFQDEQTKTDLNNLALAQAMNFFEDGGSIGGANARSYGDPFPSLELNNISLARRSHKESGLARIIKKLSDGFRIPQNLGLRNFKDPYLVIPEYHSTIAQIGAFTGSNDATRAKISFRSAGNVITGAGGIDARLGFGKQFALGIGAFGKVAYDDNDMFTLTKQDYSVHFSPKFDMGKNGSIEAGVNFNSSIINGQAKNLIAIANPRFTLTSAFDRRGVYHVSNYSETDTVTSNNIYVQTFDLGGSFMLNTDQFYIGLAMDNVLGSQLASEKIAFEGRSSLTSFTAVLGTDYKYSPTSNSTISPSLYLNQTGNHTELWLSANARFNSFMIGFGYGNHGEAAAVIGLQTRTMRLGFTTDYTKSYLEGGKMFSFGTTLRLFLGKKRGTNDLPKT